MKCLSIMVVAILALAQAKQLSAEQLGKKADCVPNGGVAYAHELYCEKYFICDNGVEREFTCTVPLLFDTVYNGCNYPELVDCGDRIPPNEPAPGPTDAPGDGYDCPSPGGAFPHPLYCDFYYVCVENVGTLEQCQADQLFDLVYSGCNWANLVDCGDRLPPTSGTNQPPGPTSAPGDFECPTPGGAFPHPDNCQKYYVCVENVPTLETCVDGQLFDLVYNGCNWDYLVNCGDRPLPGGPTQPPGTGPTPPPGTGPTPPPGTGPTQPPGDFECPVADGLFANPNDCTSFYSCANFESSLQPCPETLHFKIEGTICDFPANVDCGDRPIPSSK